MNGLEQQQTHTSLVSLISHALPRCNKGQFTVCLLYTSGFGKNTPVDAVLRPEDIDLVAPEEGTIQGVVTHLIFKGVHYEMEVLANNYELLVHSTDMFPVGTEVGIHVDPFDIQIMNKPESEDEEAVNVEE